MTRGVSEPDALEGDARRRSRERRVSVGGGQVGVHVGAGQRAGCGGRPDLGEAIGADSGPREILVIFDRDARRGHQPDEPP